ncbi:MAG: lipoyl protein ligase domain-containing protein [Candidatus Thorarchaeota archaeon]|jgi:lipoate-protein ligase A
MTLETWRLLDLGPVDPMETQTIFDMIAQGITEGESENTLIINWPAKPLVSIGYFQEIEKDIDLEFCRENDIVVARRVIGGGGVYLDDGQMFYQIIHSLDSPTSVRSINGYYRKFLKAPVQAYRNLGIDAEFKPVNDIQAGGKKISGNGAGDVGDARILSGNLIFDFNFDMMVKILRVPDEKFRDKIAQGLRQRMSTIKQLTEVMPNRPEVKEDLLRLFEENLDIKLQKGQLNSWEKKRMSELRQKYLSDEWLHWRSGGRLNTRTVRISSTTTIGTASYKAPGGLIRITIEDVEDLIIEIVISGDFTMLPSNAIESVERVLLGANTTNDEVLQRVKRVYTELSIDSPGVTPEDFATAVGMALEQK